MNTKLLNTIRVFSLGVFLLSSASVQAQAKNVQQLSSDVSTLQQDLSKIDQEMNQLRRLLDNRAMLELFQRMDEISDEVSNLRGMLEQQNHDLAGLKKRQRELYLDTDRRLRELEITSSRPPAANAAVAVEPPVTEQPDTQSESSPVQEITLLAPPTIATPPAPAKAPDQGETDKPSVTVSEERDAYQKAFDMLKEGRYKMANTAFQEFLQRYPQSSYAGNAQYWLGESNYVTRQFKEAVKEFQTVVKQYPTSNKVPDAMLKLGYTHYELHEFEVARDILNKLQAAYPKSTAARLAGKRLERMSKEEQ